MRNKRGIQLFIILFLCTFFIFSFSHFGASAFDSMIKNEPVFSEGTMLGHIDLSGKTEYEAMETADEQLTEWLNRTERYLHYKENTILLDNALFRFEISESVKAAINNQENKLLVHIDQAALNDILQFQFPSLHLNSIDFKKLNKDLSENAKMLDSSKVDIKLENYLSTANFTKEVISEATIQLEHTDPSMTGIISKVNQIEIPSGSPFSLLTFIEENGLKNESSYILNGIANGIYELILPTNFSIIERHISHEKPENVQLGYEAKIDFDQKLDFVFTNPNETSYMIELQQNEDNLHVKLIGPAFSNKYVISTKDEQSFTPKTIKQFNPLLKSGEKTVEKTGKDGMLIKIVREIYDEKGALLKKETMSEDFYPPVPQIEVHGLINKEAGRKSDSQFEPNNQQDETENSDASSDRDESTLVEEENDGVIDSKNDLWGKQKEQMK